MKTFSLIAGILLLIFEAAFFSYLKYTDPSKNLIEVKGPLCSEMAKICPDGSVVGQRGPHCEFEPCPNTTTSKYMTSNITVPAPD